MLTREQILAINDLPLKEVHVPEWGGSVYVKAMSMADAKKAFAFEDKDHDTRILRNVILGVCDKDGKPLFTDADMDQLYSKNFHVCCRLAKEVNEHNQVDMNAVDALEKK